MNSCSTGCYSKQFDQSHAFWNCWTETDVIKRADSSRGPEEDLHQWQGEAQAAADPSPLGVDFLNSFLNFLFFFFSYCRFTHFKAWWGFLPHHIYSAHAYLCCWQSIVIAAVTGCNNTPLNWTLESLKHTLRGKWAPRCRVFFFISTRSFEVAAKCCLLSLRRWQQMDWVNSQSHNPLLLRRGFSSGLGVFKWLFTPPVLSSAQLPQDTFLLLPIYGFQTYIHITLALRDMRWSNTKYYHY